MALIAITFSTSFPAPNAADSPTPKVTGAWYMGTAMGHDCELTFKPDHTLRLQYGGCFHRDPPMFAKWSQKGDIIQITGNKLIKLRLGSFLKVTFYKKWRVLLPETEIAYTRSRGFFRDHCFMPCDSGRMIVLPAANELRTPSSVIPISN